jgi:hypothetical protein
LPINTEMPAVKLTETIDVRAPASVAYGVITTDLLAVTNGPDAMTSHRPLDDGPLRPGFRFETTVVHNRKLCLSATEITDLENGRMLEQSIDHYCADAERATHAGERWELAERDDGSTVVTLSVWRRLPGLAGWLQKLFPRDDATLLSLRRRLAVVQFEAERRSGR